MITSLYLTISTLGMICLNGRRSWGFRKYGASQHIWRLCVESQFVMVLATAAVDMPPTRSLNTCGGGTIDFYLRFGNGTNPGKTVDLP